jgi:hypothetical protein
MKAVLLAVVLATAPLAPAFAQNASGDRADDQDDRRQQAWWTRIGDWLTAINDEGLYPSVGVIVAGSGLSFGAGLRDLHFGDAPVGGEIDAMWSVRGYQTYRVRFGLIDKLRNIHRLRPADAKVSSQFDDFDETTPGHAIYLETEWRDYPRMSFYGAGPSAPDETKTDFRLSGYTVDVVGQWQARAHLGVGARVGLLDFDHGGGNNPNTPDTLVLHRPETAPGLLEHPRFITTSAGLTYVRRDRTAAPRRGHLGTISVLRFEALGSGGPTVTRLNLDGRIYRPIRATGVLASRLLLAQDWTADGAPTPFYLQQTLGGSDTLRGFSSYRFRDQSLAHGSVEYRHMVWPFVELTPFLDAGTVAPDLTRVAWATVRFCPGIGVRVHFEDRVIGRLDWARSSDGHRFAFSLSHPF